LSLLFFNDSLSHILVLKLHCVQPFESHTSRHVLVNMLKKQHGQFTHPESAHALDVGRIVSIIAPPALHKNESIFEWPVKLVQFILVSELLQRLYLLVHSVHSEHQLLLLEHNHLQPLVTLPAPVEPSDCRDGRRILFCCFDVSIQSLF